MGTNKYDYILADKNIIPEKHLNFYSEKVITFEAFSLFAFHWLFFDMRVGNMCILFRWCGCSPSCQGSVRERKLEVAGAVHKPYWCREKGSMVATRVCRNICLKFLWCHLCNVLFTVCIISLIWKKLGSQCAGRNIYARANSKKTIIEFVAENLMST